MRPRIVVVAGPTATGKTALGEALAEALGGEVVCADSRQVFRELEIGTGKPTAAERATRPHHLFDWRSLGEPASAGAWAREAARVCAEVAARGATAVLVGGSGLYLSALREGLHEEPPRDPARRARLGDELAALGLEALHERLVALDPETAARLAPNDRQRTLRALEIVEATGRTLVQWRREHPRTPLDAEWHSLQLTCEGSELSRRIEGRTRTMFAAGLIEETAALVARGAGEALATLRAIGYDEALGVIGGAVPLEAALQRTIERTRQLAKRQRTWFRHRFHGEALGVEGRTEAETLAAALEALGLAR